MTAGEQVPDISLALAEQVARQHFGVTAEARPLPSYCDQNVRLDVDGVPRYVLKLANASESLDALRAQQIASDRVAAAGISVQRQHVSTDGADHVVIDGHITRLLDWLPGIPLAVVGQPSAALLRNLGQTLGTVSRALAGYDADITHRESTWDVMQAEAVLPGLRDGISDSHIRGLFAAVLEGFRSRVEPQRSSLRYGVIHADANDYNVLVNAGDKCDPANRFTHVSGLLDFGDLVYSAVVADLAVAAAYVTFDVADPVDAVCSMLAGFHQEYPLTEPEISVVWDLLRVRLALSVGHAEIAQQTRPNDPYLSISAAPALVALQRTAAIHPRFAHYRFRAARGLESHPAASEVRRYLQDAQPRQLFGDTWESLQTFAVDLSVGSHTFGSADIAAAPARFDQLIRQDSATTAIGIGGYGEARLIYGTPEFATSTDPAAERRTIHLGLDLWAPADSAVYAPHAGRVVIACNNNVHLDYGPMVVLEHETDRGTPFYSLYGHLALRTLDVIRVGQTLRAGDLLGWIGTPPTNGGWAPHVHVQVMLDLLDLAHDYPGVATPPESAVWLGLSPDPHLLLGLQIAKTTSPTLSQTAHDRSRLLGPNLSLSYAEPLRIVRGLGARLFDDQGRSYLDAVNNVAHVGHAHPRVVRAGQRQMAVLNTNTRYLHDTVVEYARRLTATLPDSLSVCFFVNSGSEANELALRLIRTATGAVDVVCLQDGYHGHSQALIDLSPYKHDGPGGRGRPDWVHVAQLPDPYRGPYRGYGRDTAIAYAGDVLRCVRDVEAVGRPLAGMIVESMVGCGGQVVLPDDYLMEAAAHIRSSGGLVIADEVQVGFGRVGPQFWGFATQGLIPDVVTMGKPAGNGHPLAVVVTTPAIAMTFANGMEYFNTFGGNPVSAAIGLAVLDVLRDEQLPERAERLGRRLVDEGRELATRHALIGDVRGLGMYVGVELVRDRDTQEPAAAEASYIVERMKSRGVLVSIDGPHHNVLKIKPPLVWTDADVDQIISTLQQVLCEPALNP